MRLALASLALIAAVTGCGRSQPEPKAALPVTETPSEARVTANIIAVDIDGRPLANMMPIATKLPNAFDPPVVRGPLTLEDGCGSLGIPSAEHLYLRAWDPEIKMFANNYYEVLPGSEMDPTPLKVTMVPGASLAAQLLTREGKLAANVAVDLKMFHPTEGVWWPARADTDQQGIIRFFSVPAGRYKVRLETASGAHFELDNLELLPGAAKDLGSITLE